MNSGVVLTVLTVPTFFAKLCKSTFDSGFELLRESCSNNPAQSAQSAQTG